MLRYAHGAQWVGGTNSTPVYLYGLWMLVYLFLSNYFVPNNIKLFLIFLH